MKTEIKSAEESHLSAVEIFQDLTVGEIIKLEDKCHLKQFTARTVFYAFGQADGDIFLIKKGRVRLYHLSTEGKIFTTAILEAGTFFGAAAFDGENHGEYAETVTDCTICLMSRHDFETVLLADSRIAFRIVEALEKRLLEAERRLAELVLKNIPARVAALLLYYARQNDTSDVRLTHEELAQMLGTRRETVTRILNDLQDRHLIEQHRGRIALLDVERLKKIGAD